MYYDFIQTHKRKVIVSTVILLAILFIWTVMILVGRIGKLPVTVSIVPSNAAITLNNESISNGTKWITPGNYTVTAKRDGFNDKKQMITVTSEKQDNIVAISLVPKSKQAKEWAQQHQDEYKNNEKYGALQASANGAYFTSQNPITKKLPYTDPYYTVGYTVNQDNSITMTISTQSPRYRFYAVEKIREWGYEPTDFRIQFKDFKNPLEQP